MINRRNFLKIGSLAATPFVFHGQWMQAFASMPAAEQWNYRPDRKLVLVQLNGGNDGLNMVIPISQYDNLANARPRILLDKNQIIKLNEETGLHPSMTEMAGLYANGKIQIIQGVGYPKPNMSHFRSKDIILSASDALTVIDTGWLGRLLSSRHPEYPAGYPNQQNPHPLALTFGSESSPVCQGNLINFSPAISNLSQVYSSDNNQETYPGTPFGNELRFVTQAMEQTESYLGVIREAAGKAKNMSLLYPAAGSNTLADQLKMVANLIAGGLQTQIYVVNLGGFDLHSAQVTSETEKLKGAHPSLLSKLSKAIDAFLDDLKLMGRQDEVIGLVYTEFGRRIVANDSLGTDHGTTWPAILFGKVAPGIVGTNPVIPVAATKNDNLTLQNDFRGIYTSLFSQWFGVEKSLITQLIPGSFPEIPVVSNPVFSGDVYNRKRHSIQVWPNPVTDKVNISCIPENNMIEVRITDLNGKTLYQQSHRVNRDSESQILIPVNQLNSGICIVTITDGNRTFSEKIIKK